MWPICGYNREIRWIFANSKSCPIRSVQQRHPEEPKLGRDFWFGMNHLSSRASVENRAERDRLADRPARSGAPEARANLPKLHKGCVRDPSTALGMTIAVIGSHRSATLALRDCPTFAHGRLPSVGSSTSLGMTAWRGSGSKARIERSDTAWPADVERSRSVR
jgi:hypothetical protein